MPPEDAISAPQGIGTPQRAEVIHAAAWLPEWPGQVNPPTPPLGNPTEKLSHAAQSRTERRDARYGLRDVLQQVSSLDRVRICGVRRIDGGQNPAILRRPEADGSMVAHFAHVMLCGRVWPCPVCGPKIRNQRAADLDTACARWIDGHGVGSVMLLTLTMPHDFGEPLGVLIGTIREAFTALFSGRAWKDDKQEFRLAHWVKAHDITHGPNGWHPHLHVVLFAEEPLQPGQLAELEDRLYSRWVRVVTNRGSRPPSRQHGIRIEQAHSLEDTSRYVCQVVTGDPVRPVPVALEVARGDLKTSSHSGHRTPWQILADFAETGDCGDLANWHEFEGATTGVQAIRWSNGLRAAVVLGEEETDEEVVQAVVGGEVVYTFTMLEWKVLCRLKGARGRVLRLAEEGGTDAVRQFMQTLGDGAGRG